MRSSPVLAATPVPLAASPRPAAVHRPRSPHDGKVQEFPSAEPAS
ncbi:hypothetical protein [Saccharothrix longispora]|nr:hypothetical protein [Saccharothrix longispora]MDU0294169.1 hypothetical protein [Saccharothrix longispora]